MLEKCIRLYESIEEKNSRIAQQVT